jgi:hypothetical protein
MAEPYYATPDELRAKVGGLSKEVLPDAEATTLISEAEDLIDERLGNRCPDETTGRKVTSEDFTELEAWRLRKLAEATIEIAAALFHDPGVQSRQRWRSLSGDVATGSPYGPVFGERAQVLLNQSGLAVPFARAGRRRSRSEQIARNFFSRVF